MSMAPNQPNPMSVGALDATLRMLAREGGNVRGQPQQKKRIEIAGASPGGPQPFTKDRGGEQVARTLLGS